MTEYFTVNEKNEVARVKTEILSGFLSLVFLLLSSYLFSPFSDFESVAAIYF